MSNIEDEDSDVLIDINSLMFSFWNDKFLFLIAFLLSIPVSLLFISTISPLYVAKAVVEVEQENISENMIPASLAKAIPFSSQLALPASAFLPKITGNKFLERVVGDGDESDRKLRKQCEYTPPSRYSSFHIFSLLGVAKISAPSEEQKKDLVLECLKKMMLVEKFQHNGAATTAYSVSIEAEDPYLAAKLANKIVGKYFEIEQETKENNFQRSMTYLSEILAEAQQDLQKYEDQLEVFLISNASLVDPNSKLSLGMGVEAALQQKIVALGQSEKFEMSILKNLRTLKGLASRPPSEFFSFVEASGIKMGLSSKFISDMSELQESAGKGSVLDFNVLQRIKEEIKRLEGFLRKKEDQRAKRENELEILIKKQMNLDTLISEIRKRTIYLSNLQDQLVAKTVQAGALSLDSVKLYSKAVPPLYPESPRKKIILVLFAAFFVFLVSVYSYSKLYLNKTVYTLSQLRRLGQIQNKIQLSSRDYDYLKERKKEAFGLNFMDDVLNAGKIGCVVDISEKGYLRKGSGENFSNSIGKIFSKKENTLVYTSRSPEQYLQLNKSKPKQAQPNLSETTRENGFVKIEDDACLLESGDFFPLRNEYNRYDRIILYLNHKIDELTKLETIRNCDYYILIGRKGKFGFKDLDKFIKEISAERSKCIALAITR